MKRRRSLVWILVSSMLPTATAMEGIWIGKANMPTARYVLASGVADGKIYAIGGDLAGGAGPGMVEEYDPTTDGWTRKADMPIAVGGAASSTVDGRIYVIGGLSSQWAPPSSSVQAYDAPTDSWSTKADMPTARGWLSTAVVNGRIYAIGGAPAFDGQVLSTVEEYDPATDTWTRRADMPTARACLSASAANGKIYAIGGTLSEPWSQAISIVEEYDPATDTWTKKSDMPTRRSYFSTAAVNGRIYAVGGFTTNYIGLSSVERYNPATDAWTSDADMPTPRWGLSASVVDGSMYAIGGRIAHGGPVSIVEQYNLSPPPPDFNGDGTVDIKDLLRLIESWGQHDPLCDIGPTAFGDGIVDAVDLEVLMRHWGQPVDDPTLLAHWALDETEGAVACDSAGQNDGRVMGAALWQPDGGYVDGALELDGATFVVGDVVLDPTNGPFSVLAWVKGGAPGQVIVSQQAGANWLTADALDGSLMTDLRAGGRSPVSLGSQTVIADGDWHRVAFAWDGINRRLYVDDVLVAEDIQNALGGSSGKQMIGCGANVLPDTFWTGLIDDVRIYNRAVKP